jgi:hypothetical protein
MCRFGKPVIAFKSKNVSQVRSMMLSGVTRWKYFFLYNNKNNSPSKAMGGTSHIDSHMSYVIVFTCDTFLLLNAITGLPNLHIVSKCWLFMVPTWIKDY